MPTYEFRCPQGHDFEKLYRTISGAETQAACPVCGQAAMRIMSATGFAFKGSGFYLTDYGKNAHRGSPDGKPAAPAASGADGSSGDSPSSSTPSEGGAAAPAPPAAPTPSSDVKKPASDASPATPAPKKSAE